MHCDDVTMSASVIECVYESLECRDGEEKSSTAVVAVQGGCLRSGS